MAKTFRPYSIDQQILLPQDLRTWLPDGHLAVFVSDVVDELDLSALSYGRLAETEQRLAEAVKRLLEEAERVDAEEDAPFGKGKRGDELPMPNWR